MLGRTDSRLRLVALLAVFAIIASLLGLRLAYWQISEGDDLRRTAAEQLLSPEDEARIERGQIVDRRGVVLATSAYRDLLAAYPDLMTSDERASTAVRLAQILGLDDQQAAALRASFSADRQYVVVARRLTEHQSDAVRAGLASGELASLGLEPRPVRFYPSAGGAPDTTLASQLLGFVTEDGQGRYGVEQVAQDVLAADGGAIASTDGTPGLPRQGGSVRLTIDASLQLRLEKELYAAWVADRARRVTGIVLDPYTGAVLAWASVPGYDANDYISAAEHSPGLFADPISGQVYEPGSVMKMFTAATALEEGVVTLDTLVVDDRQLRLGNSVVENFDRKGLGTIAFQDAIAQSRNVATGKVALSLAGSVSEASELLYDMWQRFGIGRTTGIELPAESAGIVADPADLRWQAIDLVNRSFGQAVAVTPIQLATAFAAMVNGGTLPHPHIYGAIDGQAVDVAANQQVVAPELADTLRQLLIHVVDTGANYAEGTQIPGYVVGGKTGTAQIWDNQRGEWLDGIYNRTFVGFVGGERPEAVILVRIHETEPRLPRRQRLVVQVSSNELFRRVALDAIDVLGIPPRSSPAMDGSGESELPLTPSMAPSMAPSPSPGAPQPVPAAVGG